MMCDHMNINRKPQLEFCKRQERLLTGTSPIRPEADSICSLAKAALNSRRKRGRYD